MDNIHTNNETAANMMLNNGASNEYSHGLEDRARPYGPARQLRARRAAPSHPADWAWPLPAGSGAADRNPAAKGCRERTPRVLPAGS